MLTHSSGMLPGGWAYAFSASGRHGENINVQGTYFRGSSFYAAIDKVINRKHIIGLTAFAAPVEQGRAAANVKEIFVLADDNRYNSNWGYQAARKRNSRVSKSIKPTIILNHEAETAGEGKLISSLFFSAGRDAISGIHSTQAPQHRPDYYRNLPSYYYMRHDSSGAALAEAFWADPSNRQIDWDRMISLNQANLYTEPRLLGQMRNTRETRARYIIENQVQEYRQASANCMYNRRIKKLFFSSGLNFTLYSSRKFKEIEDLLGASFWLDTDQFAEGLGVEESIIQNDIDRPNRKVREGEHFGYDYSIAVKRAASWAQLEFGGRRIDAYAAFLFSYNGISRQGFVANGKFPDNSEGKGPVVNLSAGGAKAGITLKISGRQYITSNILAQSRVPSVSAMYISPQTRHDLTSGITNEKVLSTDMSYHIKSPSFKLRVTAYHTRISDQLWLRSYWDETYNTGVNLVMSDVAQQFQGLELGIEKTLLISHVLQAAVGYGEFMYTGRPLLQGWQDNTGTPLFSERKVYLRNYRVGGTPQTVAGLGYRFNSPRRWFAGVNVNYIANNYVEPNPLRRTEEAAGKFLENESAQAMTITAQEKLPGYALVNALAGKTWRVKRKYMIAAHVSLNNLLHNRNIISNGYEQLRFDPAYPEMFPAKYSYMTGLTFMANVSLTF
jgi:hypothetical protein